MPRLELRVESGGNAHNSVDTQNGNIFWLRYIFGLPICNEEGVIINETHIERIQNADPNGTYFTNADGTTTDNLHVNINQNMILATIHLVNIFKQDLQKKYPNVNFSQIVGENTIDSRDLDPHSVIRAIELIWFNFKSDRIYEDMRHDRVNSKKENQPDSHRYVNAAYDDYMQSYRLSEGLLINNPLRYIHPLLFPRIFFYAFAYNHIPKSSYETDIAIEYYNTIITQNNRLYVQNQTTTLYIYRCSIAYAIRELSAIKKRLGRAPLGI